MTDAERKLWRELRLQQFGVKFRRHIQSENTLRTSPVLSGCFA
jgi:hypothetical protein